MQSLNKMPSFGDDILFACMQAEVKSMDIISTDSDMEKYFQDSTFFSKEASNSNNTDKIAEPKTSNILHGSVNTRSNVNQDTSEAKKCNINSVISSRSNVRNTTLKKSKIKNIATQKKAYNLSKKGKENANINCTKSDTLSKTNTLSEQYKMLELPVPHSGSKNITSNITHSVTDDVSSKLSNTNTTTNRSEKFTETNPSISTVATQDRCKLSAWGLPPNILQKYESKGITTMFSWQVECLSNHKVMEEKRNLVYSAPTSAGKTLVAEILMIKTVLERKKKVIFILPFISVVREKMYYFQDLLSSSGVRVEGFMGGIAPPGGFASTHVAIATIEKANSLVNRLMEENELVNLGAVVIDELHLVGDRNRGYLLELLLTKLKYMTLRDENINIQLIGMSATLPNLSLLSEWLDAELYKTDFRPIPLNEQCKIGKNIYDNKLCLIRSLTPMPELTIDSDDIVHLCIETIAGGHSALIFCPTKNWCEKLAGQIAATFFKIGREDTELGETLRKQLDSTLISETLEQLKRSPIGLDNVLKSTVSFGTAFHHAGLTMDERDIIEGSFRAGSLRVLVATSTLSSGVNLPARRVIIRSPMFAGKLLDSLTYRQMIGRAGRMGKDTAGESILLCNPSEKKAAKSLLSATLEPIESCLEDSGPLIRALLEAIASEVVYTPSDLELYIKCTLINLSDEHNRKNPSNEAIKFLIDNEFLLLQTTEEGHRWVATAFGKACLAASIPPRDGLFLLEELQRARRCFVLDTELHVIYLVTPVNSGSQIATIDWMSFMEIWKTLSESERRVGQLVGVEERFLTSAITGIIRPGKLLSIHKRFYTALALHDLVREVPLDAVCKKYGCCRGVLQSLQQSASTFAGMVTQFCKQLGWDCMELLVSQFQTRLQFGVCRELLDLLRLPMLNGLRARSLYKQGITCVADLAVANELDVERALYKALPFESEKEQDGEHESEAVKRNKMRTVFVTGKDGLTPHEAAVLLVHEARVLVQNELGLQDMSWKRNEKSFSTDNSNSEISSKLSQDMLQSTINTKQQTSIKIPASNTSPNKVQEVNHLLQDKQAEESCETMNQNIQCTNQSKNSLTNKVCETEILKADVYTVKRTKDSKSTTPTKKLSQENKNDNAQITDQLLQIEFFDTQNEKFSIDFFDESSPKMHNSTNKRDSQSLISFKDNKIKRTQNVSTKNSMGNMQNENDIPVKKVRTSMEKNITPKCNENTLDFEISTKQRVSRSPSLFDDSLNLDTQLCNALEQNIDSLHFSDFEKTEMSVLKVGIKNTTGNNSQSTTNVNKEVKIEKNVKNNCSSKNDLNITNTQMKLSAFSWKDVTWNEPKKITEKLNQMNNKNIEDESIKCNIKNIKNTNVQQTIETVGTNNSTPKMKKESGERFQTPTSVSNDLRRITQKRIFKSISVEKSPAAKVIVFNENRRGSLDLSRSNSEDIVIASQDLNSPLPSIRIRTKLDSEKKQKICTQRIPNCTSDDVTNRANVPSKGIQIEKHKIKPKLNEIQTENILTRKDSTDSVISNSDEDTPMKSAKILQKSRIVTKKVRKEAEACVQTNKFIENINDLTNWNTLNIVKVGSDRGTFNLFKREVMQKRYIALALNCEMYCDTRHSIGSKIISSTNTERKKRSRKSESYVHADKRLCGAAISWENNIAYYISFSNEQDLRISGREQMKLLKELLSNPVLNIKCFASKEIFRTLYECCGISASCKFLDPKVASWLYDGSVSEKLFNEMVKEYFPQGCFITKRIGTCYDIGPGLNIKSSIPGEFRASAEAVLTWHITDSLLDKLEQLNPTLLYTFKDIEMKTVIILACMELTGFSVCLKSLQDLSSIISDEIMSLQERAYALCGRKFKFSSSKQVAEILGLYKGKKLSVNKAVLGQSEHPISSLIMSWRKLSATQSKFVYPILSLAQHDPRIHGNCVTRTLTGRISMHEPNLQNIPKNFYSEDNSFLISLRMAFVPAMGNIMLSADYCQLELRILAHFSKDAILCDIMRKPGDIFKNIAANWNHVSEEQVDDKMRQHTKQLCYGMIYGMGVKTLAETLSVDETKAKEFLDSFMSTYPNISKWLNTVIEEARSNGYITTILERRRMLPGLMSTNSAEKAQAERQAVNTKVQGSAADIAKKAMVNIDERLRYEFLISSSIMPANFTPRQLRSNTKESQQRGGFLVLQLHDELLYEVNLNDLRQVAKIVKESMEQVCQLAVPLPVKLKVGPAWGDLSEYTL